MFFYGQSFFIGNPDVDSLCVVSDAILTLGKAAIMGYCIESFRRALISLILSSQSIRAGEKSRSLGSLAISAKIKLSDTFQSKL